MFWIVYKNMQKDSICQVFQVKASALKDDFISRMPMRESAGNKRVLLLRLWLEIWWNLYTSGSCLPRHDAGTCLRPSQQPGALLHASANRLIWSGGGINKRTQVNIYFLLSATGALFSRQIGRLSGNPHLPVHAVGLNQVYLPLCPLLWIRFAHPSVTAGSSLWMPKQQQVTLKPTLRKNIIRKFGTCSSSPAKKGVIMLRYQHFFGFGDLRPQLFPRDNQIMCCFVW